MLVWAILGVGEMVTNYNDSDKRWDKLSCTEFHWTTLRVHCIRSTSNPMDKGACNFVNSKIQTWPPSTIKSNFIKFFIRIIHGDACSSTSRYRHHWNEAKAERYSERIVAEVKQESLLLYTGNVKITPVDYYKFILRFGSLTFETSLAFVTQHDEMVVHSVHPCCA